MKKRYIKPQCFTFCVSTNSFIAASINDGECRITTDEEAADDQTVFESKRFFYNPFLCDE